MTVNQLFLADMKSFAERAKAQGLELELPPKSLLEMKGEYIAWEPGKLLKARFPYDPRFANPTGTFQGGMLCTAMDNVWGPLTYATMKVPCVTLELSTSFVRPFLPADEWIEVLATITATTRNLIFMDGIVTSGKTGKLLATGKSHSMIVPAR